MARGEATPTSVFATMRWSTTLDGSASLVAWHFVEDGDALRSAEIETTRYHLVDAGFKDAGVPAREAVASVEDDAMMILLMIVVVEQGHFSSGAQA